jgi:hypothetical protein
MAETPKRKRGRKADIGSGIRVRGFFRVNLVEHEEVSGAPRIVGDSGWVENTITTIGKAQYLALALAGNASSKYVAKMALGTGTAPATNSTSLLGEFADMTGASSTRNRMSVSTSTGVTGATVTVQYAATWASSDGGFVTAAHTISNIGLHWTGEVQATNVSSGSLFAGTTYGSSQLNTNQDVQASYVISFN